MGGSESNVTGVFIKESWDTRAQRKDHGGTQGEGSQLQAKEKGLRRNQPCRHLDLGPQPPVL